MVQSNINIPYWVMQKKTDPDPSGWDLLVMYNSNNDVVQFPGVAMVSAKVHYKVEVGVANGNDIAPTTDRGRMNTELDVVLKMVGPDDWAQWLNVIREFSLGTVGKPRGPYAIFHPMAQAYGVNTVMIREINAPAVTAAEANIVTMKLVEYGKPLPVKQAKQSSLSALGIKSTQAVPKPGSDAGSANVPGTK